MGFHLFHVVVVVVVFPYAGMNAKSRWQAGKEKIAQHVVLCESTPTKAPPSQTLYTNYFLYRCAMMFDQSREEQCKNKLEYGLCLGWRIFTGYILFVGLVGTIEFLL